MHCIRYIVAFCWIFFCPNKCYGNQVKSHIEQKLLYSNALCLNRSKKCKYFTPHSITTGILLLFARPTPLYLYQHSNAERWDKSLIRFSRLLRQQFSMPIFYMRFNSTLIISCNKLSVSIDSLFIHIL